MPRCNSSRKPAISIQMTNTIYEIREKGEVRFSMRLAEPMEMNFWNFELVTSEQFECRPHELVALNEHYNFGSSNNCCDICRAETAIWTVPRKHSDFLMTLKEQGCRITKDVSVAKGQKQFDLVYAAPVLDLLDLEATSKLERDFDLDNLVWNGDMISWVRTPVFYSFSGDLPMMFQVVYRNRDNKVYNGSTFGLSGKTYVSEFFKAEYEERQLTGLEFFEVMRSEKTPQPDVFNFLL